MDTLAYVRQHVLPAALGLLPPAMTSPEARALLIAIGLQESRFVFRHQIGGPALGFWQFERAGVHGVLSHPASRPNALIVLKTLSYMEDTSIVHEALADNDTLAAIIARLLLWTSPLPLPKRGDADAAWNLYLKCWRPGKPIETTWDEIYDYACGIEEGK